MVNRILNPVDKVCKTCNKMMYSVRRDRKYCSSICTNKASHYISHKNCLSCGCEMKNIHGHQKYCTIDCYRKTRRYEVLCKKDLTHIEKTNRLSRIQTLKVKTFLQDFKVEKGCIDCGFNSHHAALQFDHVRGDKRMNVCKAKSIEAAKLEIEKCEVVCSNCHHIRTWNRLKEKKT